jgi:hypothetical protein
MVLPSIDFVQMIPSSGPHRPGNSFELMLRANKLRTRRGYVAASTTIAVGARQRGINDIHDS